jgi:hypothetical protein
VVPDQYIGTWNFGQAVFPRVSKEAVTMPALALVSRPIEQYETLG